MPVHERIDAIIRLAVIVLFAALPWFFLPVSWISVDESKLYFLGVILIIASLAWFYARVRERGVTIAWTPIYLAAISTCLAYAISTALAGFTSVSIVGNGSNTDTLAFVLAQTALLIFIASLFSGHPGVINRALRALFLGGFIALILEIMHLLLPSFLTSIFPGVTSNVFGNWHEFALFIGFLLVTSIAFSPSPMLRGRWSFLGWGVGVVSCALLIIVNYTDVWELVAGALLALVAMRLCRAEKRDTRFWRGQLIALFVALFSLGSIFYGNVIVAQLPSALNISPAHVRPSLIGTLQIGRESLTQPKTFIFGTGPNTFMREWGRYKPIGVNATPFWDVDFPTGIAAYPTAFITVGFAGLLTLIAFAVTLLALIWQFIRSRTASPVASLVAPLSVITLYLLALQALAVPGPILTILLFISAGLLIALLAPTLVRERHIGMHVATMRGRAVLAGVGLFVLLAIIPAAAMIRVIASNDLLNRAVATYNAGGDIARASTYVQEALIVYPQNDAAQRTAVQFGLLRLQQLASAQDASQDAARAQLAATLQETIKHGLAAVSIDGDNYQNWLLLASLYGQLAGSNVDGAYDNARLAYQKALAAHPRSPVPYLSLAQLEILQGHDGVALAYLQQAVQLKPDLADAYFLASQIYARGNNAQNALRAAETAVQYAPDNSTAWYNVGTIAYGSGQYDEAAVALKRALALQPTFANALYVLGLTYYAEHDAADALSTFQTLDALVPNQPIVGRIIAKLAAGGELTPTDFDPNAATSAPAKMPTKKTLRKKH